MATSQKNKSQLLDFYQQMLMLRRFEEKIGQLYGMGVIGGFCHLYIGQEAVVVGTQAALQKGDSCVTSYRDHAHAALAGISMEAVIAELTGREAGCSRGKGGSMHMFAPELGFYGGHGIVGAQVPIGTGLAFAHQYRGDGGVTACYFGDGAVNQGQVYESFNMAALWKLPIIYIIENNRYGMGTSIERASATTDLCNRGVAYGIKGYELDGMNVEEVYEQVGKIAKNVRSGKGPAIIEMKTYRYRGHSMSDPARYRSKEEVQDMKEHHDALLSAKDQLLAQKITTEDELKAMEKTIREEVAKAAEFAQNAPEPELSELYTDVYGDANNHASVGGV